MGLFNKNIGLEFQNQMKVWLSEYPEVNHEWRKTELIIYHPTNKSQKVSFLSNSKSVTITFQETKKVFKREFFQDIATQVLKIRGYWIRNTFQIQDLEIRKPKLCNNQVAVLHCNSKFGHVLTIDLNLFTGWGEVYRIFDNIEFAKEYCESIRNHDIETSIFDSDDNFIERTN